MTEVILAVPDVFVLRHSAHNLNALENIHDVVDSPSLNI